MKVLGFLLCTLAALLLSAENFVSGTVIEVPDEWVNGSDPAFEQQESLREKRQLKLSCNGSEKAGTIRLDGQKTLFDNGKTKVDGNAFYQRSWQQGMPPHNAGGIGARVSYEVWKGLGGQSLNLFASFQREFNTGSKPNVMGGIRLNF